MAAIRWCSWDSQTMEGRGTKVTTTSDLGCTAALAIIVFQVSKADTRSSFDLSILSSKGGCLANGFTNLLHGDLDRSSLWWGKWFASCCSLLPSGHLTPDSSCCSDKLSTGEVGEKLSGKWHGKDLGCWCSTWSIHSFSALCTAKCLCIIVLTSAALSSKPKSLSMKKFNCQAQPQTPLKQKKKKRGGKGWASELPNNL